MKSLLGHAWRTLLACVMLLAIALPAAAQTLTAGQRTTLLAAVKANGTANAFRLAGDVPGLLGWLNGSSATLAWRNAVSSQDSDEAATYTSYDTLAQGKRDSWALFLRFNRDFSRNKVRNWVIDVWGAATAASISEAILQAGTELATNAQAALGGTVRTTGTVSATARSYTLSCDAVDANWLINQP